MKIIYEIGGNTPGFIRQGLSDVSPVEPVIAALGGNLAWLTAAERTPMDGYFVSDGALTARPMLTAPATTTITLGQSLSIAVPKGSAVSIDYGDPIVIDDGDLELTGSLVGDYHVHVEYWPYIPADWVITCESS